MCGIAGVASKQPSNLGEIARLMSDAIVRRGPDDFGVWEQKASGVAFGFRRLAILDLTPEGHQPMASKSGRFTIVFNGEIYNFLELKAELQNLGAAFRGGSDTEVILAGAEQWGVKDLLSKMNGMFGIALWDESEKCLYLARDRLGKKPLYYGWSNQHFFFGSELKAIVATGLLAKELSPDGVQSFFERGYIPSPLCIYKGIYKLPPGSYLKIVPSNFDLPPTNFNPYPDPNSDGATTSPEQFWSVLEASRNASANQFVGTEDEALNRAESILKDAVEKRMISDVPLGAFLSGGIDSSLVVSMMQKLSSTPVRTYCIGFKEKEFDESEPARKVAENLGTKHSELMVSVSDGLKIIPTLADVYDEPLADASQIPSILVSQMARKEVTVALNGDGGDELFVGYNRYLFPEEISKKIGRVPKFLRKGMISGVKALPQSITDRMLDTATSMMSPGRRPSRPREAYDKLLRLLELESSDSIYDFLTRYYPSSISKQKNELHGPLLKISELSEQREFVRKVTTLDMATYLPDDLLAKIDRATMACSLEGRSPLLDYRLLEFALSLPASLKIKNNEKKYFLKKLLERYLPRELFDRPKVGFSLPIGAWLKGELKGWAEERLVYLETNLSEIIDMPQIWEKWRDHQDGKKLFPNEIWTAVIFSQWHERWMKA